LMAGKRSTAEKPPMASENLQEYPPPEVAIRLSLHTIVGKQLAAGGELVVGLAISEGRAWALLAAPVCGFFAVRQAQAFSPATSSPGNARPNGRTRLLVTCVAACVAVPPLIARSSTEAWAYTVFFAGLAYLAVIDLRLRVVPVGCSLALVAAGLAFHFFNIGPAAAASALAAAAAAYLSFRLLDLLFERLRGRSGLGAGDALIAAVIGAWLSYTLLAWAVCLGAGFTLAYALSSPRRLKLDPALPLAPGLAAGSLAALVASRLA
jgi:hypothetical protein